MSELDLSPRQIEVCALVAAGASPKEVGKELKVSTRTVRFHMEEAAKRLQPFIPHITGSPRRIICGYYVEYAGVVAFQKRRKAA